MAHSVARLHGVAADVHWSILFFQRGICTPILPDGSVCDPDTIFQCKTGSECVINYENGKYMCTVPHLGVCTPGESFCVAGTNCLPNNGESICSGTPLLPPTSNPTPLPLPPTRRPTRGTNPPTPSPPTRAPRTPSPTTSFVCISCPESSFEKASCNSELRIQTVCEECTTCKGNWFLVQECSSTSNTICEPCPPNMEQAYNNVNNLPTCRSCPPGLVTHGPGVGCNSCTAGFYPTEADNCVPCPPIAGCSNVVCGRSGLDGACLQCEAGLEVFQEPGEIDRCRSILPTASPTQVSLKIEGFCKDASNNQPLPNATVALLADDNEGK